jgi:hypothetical protein
LNRAGKGPVPGENYVEIIQEGLGFGMMEQVRGGRCAEKSIWGERRKHRRSEEMRNGVGPPDGMTTYDDDVGWRRVLSICFCPFVILFPLVSTEELRVDELLVDELSVCM